MAQNGKKSEGLCRKLQNAVSPFRPRIRRVPDQPRGSISVACDKNSVRNTSPQTSPVHHVLHQSMTIPVEFKHFTTSHFSKESDDRNEIAIVRGQKFAKSTSGNEHGVRSPKARPEKDGDDHPVHEGEFSDYISNFKNRMMKTASHVDGGGGGGGGNSIKRIGFNED